MSRLPLILAADRLRWRQDPPEVEGEVANKVFERDGHTCRFCDFHAPGHQEVMRLDSGPASTSLDPFVTACPLCHECQYLGRDTVEQSFAVIWLPDVSQAVLNHLVRAVHIVLHAFGEPAHMGERPVTDTPPVRSAFNAYRALATRMDAALRRIGTTSPRELGAALLSLPPALAPRRRELAGGVRLLSRGRLFRDGRDVYPDLLEAWTAQGGPCHGLLKPLLAQHSPTAMPQFPEPAPP